MLKPSAWVIAGAVLATAGAAHAQERGATQGPSQAAATQAVVPWYERFTTSSGVTETIGAVENDRLPPPAWTLNQRWGITVDVREAQRIERAPEGRGDQTSLGAYYQFTPRVRVGGQVSLESSDRLTGGSVAAETEEEGARAGVRIESAFRF